jgi:hypothetical protein
MAWQAQLFIGQPVRSYEEARAILTKLGVTSALAETGDTDLPNVIWKVIPMTYLGKKFAGEVYFSIEREGGSRFPTPKGQNQNYTDAAVVLDLTSRYEGSILDAEETHGRPEPFVFDPIEVADLLTQVRAVWPEAQALIWGRWY